ncbi:HAD family hydrolase [Amycolatopsis jiangsuensis]|uniref:Phosphoglycolate phosphatase-like HAD superfamily hydrolase n=1 Tax=Amycolatopsis jiangsuensis TaxID=1181879 RepID=A0A840IV69_9PSEU|nr:haloacid dehalogenase-like hydrolase [Amycolatopsis jiangsuensis]MBB4685227.1 phosphoglycolate phosphatase-like HAD superfamily hydrolase [Amycolatopsis jiangsuensis]
MTTRAHRLVLWDIDHTLVDYTGLGSLWYADALATATGVRMHTQPDYGGRTERAISTDILTLHGIEADDEVIRRLWRELVAVAGRAEATLPEQGRALEGAAAALAEFAGRDGVVQTLVTGNLPEISRYKLAAFGLDTHLDLEIGGYGSLSAHRRDLVPHAVSAAAEKHGAVFAPEAVVIIGDTPNDVRAALDHGAVAVAVATGRYSAAELADAGAHTVLPDLADLDAVRTAVLG